jgi:phenylpyruvate tautomerase PptA (4-oxalocrotonate tautomerase family)
MPLVHIDLVEGRSDEQLAALAETVYEVEREVFAAPEDDRYIIITEHKPGRMFLGSTGLGYRRSSEAMVIQITEQNRNRDQKEALYRSLTERLRDTIGLRPEDLIVSVVASKLEDWSFGLGRAQFLTGELGSVQNS